VSLTEFSSYPKYTGVLLKALDVWYYDPDVTTPILKLMAELVQNKSQVRAIPAAHGQTW
jgi:hypothetical protein